MAVIRQNGLARNVRFRMPYRDIFDHLVLAAARDGRYKGSGEIIINRKEVIKTMDTNAKSTAQGEKLNGLFVRGVVMSSTAKALKRKDGTGVFVIARHELALQPGLAVWEAFHDPKDGKVKLDGENVIEFPKLTDFQQVTLKVLRWEEKDKRFIIKDAELVP